MAKMATRDHVNSKTTPNKDRKSTRLNSSHANISYAVFCLKKKQLIKTRAILVSSTRPQSARNLTHLHSSLANFSSSDFCLTTYIHTYINLNTFSHPQHIHM